MRSRSIYDTDLAVSLVIRIALYAAILAVIPFVLAGCSTKEGPQGGRFNATASADYQQLPAGGSSDQTRNPLPQRGADEKSDSSLTKPPI
ncbi:TPA_asm: hypothetical protein [ssRNA phage Gerhypos.1_2]|uniref:Lipoprotein n=2 Tax=Leviviricetes TaxID=2842243 RepID=A0A8S5KXG2_9VIRU|nr:hypothetical protein QIP85_gp3 [ssRNA phage Gerhypos.1_2]QDH86967.1 MAG: hypothetical protein H1Bulk28FD47_000003 [Leviviridae sp.]DAD50382.1 TPA_asm: hypothetical protein [ssRNA phage Gerhypos.1_2]